MVHLMPPAEQEFMQTLRARTAPMHEALEENPYSKAIVAETITREEYVTFLKLFYGFMKPLENAVYDQLSDTIPSVEERKRTDALAKDLMFFGMDESAVRDLPLCPELPRTATKEACLGVMYVFEGSTLGGQVITRHLNKALGLEAPHGVNFFSGHGKETGPLWKEFLGAFTTASVASGNEQEVIRSAEETFTLFGKWLNQ